MQEVLALGLSSMRDDMHRLDYIGANLANAMTPGYKREVPVGSAMAMANPQFSTVVDALQSQAPVSNGTGSSAALSPTLAVRTDVQAGSLKSTGRSLDLALAGAGYFEVLGDSGPLYTRQGDFRVDARGRLVTARGLPVMGQGGEIYLNTSDPVIDAAGNVYEGQGAPALPATNSSSKAASNGMHAPGGQPVARIKVVQFDDPRSVQRLGDGMVRSGSATAQVKEGEVQVRQGWLENSNVNSMQEMVQLIQTMRHFESMQKVVVGYDDMTGQAIRKLGDLS